MQDVLTRKSSRTRSDEDLESGWGVGGVVRVDGEVEVAGVQRRAALRVHAGVAG